MPVISVKLKSRDQIRREEWNRAIIKAAKVAEQFKCGGCGMDGKAAEAIRALAKP